MSLPILGLHHITAMAGNPPVNDAFWTDVLGMRRVKQTINYDDPGTYHLYFGDKLGRPGSLWTTFPHPMARPRQPGSPEVALTSLAVPDGSLDRWRARLADAGCDVTEHEGRLRFQDPDGTDLEIAEGDIPAEYEGITDGPSGGDAVRCVESVTVRSLRPDATGRFLEDAFGFTRDSAPADPRGVLYVCGDGAASRRVRVLDGSGMPHPRLGAGAVHHVAFRLADDEAQAEALKRLPGFGVQPTPVQDRQYFHSIYFREPGGVLFEVATDTPGFNTDESVETLGQKLQLPEWLESQRSRVVANLVPLNDTKTAPTTANPEGGAASAPTTATNATIFRAPTPPPRSSPLVPRSTKPPASCSCCTAAAAPPPTSSRSRRTSTRGERRSSPSAPRTPAAAPGTPAASFCPASRTSRTSRRPSPSSTRQSTN